MNPNDPVPLPRRGKVPPIPPIAVGSGFLGEEGDPDVFRLAAEYANAEFVDETVLSSAIDERIADLYNEAFAPHVAVSFCLICGTLKGGPWSKCPKCWFKPTRVDDLAMHFATTAFNPGIRKESPEFRLRLARKHIQGDSNFVNSLASGMLKKMEPVLGKA
jgi:hypothetical protein